MQLKAVLVFQTLLFASLSWSSDLVCNESRLAEITPQERMHRSEGAGDLVKVLSERKIKDAAAEILIKDISTRPKVQFESRFFPARLFGKIKVLESWEVEKQEYETRKGCTGGEVLVSQILCEKNLILNESRCLETCTYYNQATDCIPD